MSEDTNKHKKRGVNFTQYENEVLVDLIIKYSEILNNKKCDSISWKEKNACWEVVREEFAAQTGLVRTVKALKYKYDNIKKQIKKKIFHEKKIYQTASGPPINFLRTDLEDKLVSLLATPTERLSNNWDCDCIPSKLLSSDTNDSETQQDVKEEPMDHETPDWIHYPPLLKSTNIDKLMRTNERASGEVPTVTVEVENTTENGEIGEMGRISQRVANNIPCHIVPGPSCELSSESDSGNELPKVRKKRPLIKTEVLKAQIDFWECQKKIAEEQHVWARERHEWDRTIAKFKKEKLLLELEKLKSDISKTSRPD